jgi:hypothetical protein
MVYWSSLHSREAQEFWPICVFDWVEDHEIWRHMDAVQSRGYVRKTVVVRSIATVGTLEVFGGWGTCDGHER